MLQFLATLLGLKCVFVGPIFSSRKNDDPVSDVPNNFIFSGGHGVFGSVCGPIARPKPPGLGLSPCLSALYSCRFFGSTNSLAKPAHRRPKPSLIHWSFSSGQLKNECTRSASVCQVTSPYRACVYSGARRVIFSTTETRSGVWYARFHPTMHAGAWTAEASSAKSVSCAW